MTGAEAAVVAPIVGGALAGGGAAAGGKGGGGGEIPTFFRNASNRLSEDIQFSLLAGGPGAPLRFDEAGNLLTNQGSMTVDQRRAQNVGARIFGGGDNPGNKLQGASLNEKSLAEAMNFFANLYNNPDIGAALGEFRNRLVRDPATGLVSDPAFELIRERGVAESIEAGRRLGGLRSSGTGRGVADFLTSAEAQQRLYEDERAASAANALFNLNFLRGQAGFIPTQTLGSVTAALGGATTFAPIPQFSNSAGAAGQLAGGFLKQGATAAQGKGQQSANAQAYSLPVYQGPR